MSINTKENEMTFRVSDMVRGKTVNPPRIILLGVEKIGKSTFAASAPNAACIPIKGERGLDSIDVFKFPNACGCWSDFQECLTSLYQDPHEFQTAVIDSASTLEPLIWQDVCVKNGNVDNIVRAAGGYGNGFKIALDYWRYVTAMLDALQEHRGMASILIGHVTVGKFDDPKVGSYDRYRWDINEKAASVLYRWADCILFADTQTVVRNEDAGFNKKIGKGIDITGGARFLYTQKRPAHPGGGRGPFGHIPYELPLDWNTFQHCVSEAVKAGF
jgi:hypothetical protein